MTGVLFACLAGFLLRRAEHHDAARPRVYVVALLVVAGGALVAATR